MACGLERWRREVRRGAVAREGLVGEDRDADLDGGHGPACVFLGDEKG